MSGTMILPFHRSRNPRHQGWRRIVNLTTVIPTLLTLTILYLFAFGYIMSSPILRGPKHPNIIHSPNRPYHLKYTTITGFFAQDDEGTDGSFDYANKNFGLKEQGYDTDVEFDPELQRSQWERFAYKVKTLNNEAPKWKGKEEKKALFKVLYLGRHGQGDHNVAEAFYGTEAWDCYWAAQEGNGTVSWADAELTGEGAKQAESNHAFWKEQLAKKGMPAPESWYVSPLIRCLHTANLTFGGLDFGERGKWGVEGGIVPTIKELLREANGIHTCDRRSTKSHIASLYPHWPIEPGFTEEDLLWSPTLRETNPALDARIKKLLFDIFTHDESTFISMTSHSGAIGGILRVLGHREFKLKTGGAIPVLVKVELVSRDEPPLTGPTGTPAKSCPDFPTPTSTPAEKIVGDKIIGVEPI